MDLNAIRTAIVEADDIDRVPVEVPEWGIPKGVTELRGMTGAGKAEWLADVEAAREDGNKYGHNPSLLRRTWFHIESGQSVLDGTGLTDEQLNEKAGKVLERLAAAALKLSEAAEGGEVKAPEGAE